MGNAAVLTALHYSSHCSGVESARSRVRGRQEWRLMQQHCFYCVPNVCVLQVLLQRVRVCSVGV